MIEYPMNQQYSIAIIGGGIVGLAIAYELSSHGYKNISVIEGNHTIPGLNQSSSNGGVIHSGLYYLQDIEPLKARLSVEGNALMYQFCKKYGLPHKRTGKLVLASNPNEEEYLDFFLKIGIENGVKVKKISGKEAQRMEPNVRNIAMALYVPSTGSAALLPLIEKLKELAENNGVKFLLGTKVIAIHASKKKFTITAQTGQGLKSVNSDVIINAAGIYADEIAKMVNPSFNYQIDPARGELYKYYQSRKNISLSGMHLYATPFFYYNDTKQIAALPIVEVRELLKAGKVTKTLGSHISPAFEHINGKYVMGNIATVGPLKSLNIIKEDYAKNLKRSKDYIQKVHHFFPNLRAKDLKPHLTGIMAVVKGFTDFIIKRDEKFPNCIHLVGMDSPAWTASLAISKYVRNLL